MVDPNPGPSCCEATALTTGLDHWTGPLYWTTILFNFTFTFSSVQDSGCLHFYIICIHKKLNGSKHNEIHVTRTTQLTYYELNLH